MSPDEKQLTKPSATEAPSYIQVHEGGRGEGLESYRPGDVQIPRLALMQAMTPAVQDGKWKSGDLVHSVLDELIAEAGDPVRIVVVKHFLQWIEWKPRSEGGGIIDTSTDPDGDLASAFARGETVMDGDKEISRVVEYHNFVALLPEALGLTFPMMICCGKTNWKHGKNLLSRMVMRGPQYDAYAGAYTVRSADETNKRNERYKVFKFENAGWATKEEHEAGKAIFDAFKDVRVTTKIDEAEGDEAQGQHAETEF